MILVRPPGVYRAQGDTFLLAEVLRQQAFASGTRVLDLGTGTGALAVTAARHGAAEVTAVDISRQALAAAWLNARCRGLSLRVRQGDLLAPVPAAERFDVIVSNPPYVPAQDTDLPRRGASRAWDAGLDGRALLDRVCAEAPRFLAPGGRLLLVHSALCGVDATLGMLDAAGLASRVVARCQQPFGPVLQARAALLEARGLIRPGQRHEELVVICGERAE